MTFFLSVVTDFKFNNPKFSDYVLSQCKFSIKQSDPNASHDTIIYIFSSAATLIV